MNNTNQDNETHILSLLEIGSRLDAAHLKELEAALSLSLHSGRQFASLKGLPDNWHVAWQRNWDKIETILRRTTALVNEMAGRLDSHESDHLQHATAAWEGLQCEGDRLHEALASIHTLANGLPATDRQPWNLLARQLESELEAIHYCAEALRIKLELQKSHSKEAADRLVRTIGSKLPKRNEKEGGDAALYDHELRHAVIELQRENHEYLGYMDVVKGLFLWAENPDSRMRGNRSLSVSN